MKRTLALGTLLCLGACAASPSQRQPLPWDVAEFGDQQNNCEIPDNENPTPAALAKVDKFCKTQTAKLTPPQKTPTPLTTPSTPVDTLLGGYNDTMQ